MSIVILCPYVSQPELSQPDCQGTSGPNKVCVGVCVCHCASALQPFSLAFCRSGVESFTASQHKAYTFNLCLIVCVALSVRPDGSYQAVSHILSARVSRPDNL